MPDHKAASSTQKSDLVVTRIFDAPVKLVWSAWTEPDQVMRWWGPNRFTCPSAKMDFREGGTSLVCMKAPKEFGGQDMYSTWHYRRNVPFELIEYIRNLADQDGNKMDPVKLGMPPDFPRDQRHIVAFESLPGDKTQITVTEYGWSPGKMMELSKLGLEQCLNKMAAIFVQP